MFFLISFVVRQFLCTLNLNCLLEDFFFMNHKVYRLRINTVVIPNQAGYSIVTWRRS